jgi:hypothetical protein
MHRMKGSDGFRAWATSSEEVPREGRRIVLNIVRDWRIQSL